MQEIPNYILGFEYNAGASGTNWVDIAGVANSPSSGMVFKDYIW